MSNITMKPTTAVLAALVLLAACSASNVLAKKNFSPTEAVAAMAKGNPKGGIDNWLLEGGHPFLTRIGNYYYMLITRCRPAGDLFSWTVGRGIHAIRAVLQVVPKLASAVACGASALFKWKEGTAHPRSVESME